jgi:hypothetical protein
MVMGLALLHVDHFANSFAWCSIFFPLMKFPTLVGLSMLLSDYLRSAVFERHVVMNSLFHC